MEDLPTVDALLIEQNWIYRGDAGADGGHLFVLESTPWVRVSHAHAVLHDDAQWRRYLHFRDYLRSNAQARAAYAATKRQLLDELGPEESRRTYTERKNEIVSTLLDEAGWSSAN